MIPLGWARTGQHAVEMTQSLRPDVVLMDIGLPDIDGIRATQRINGSCPTPVVMLTVFDAPELIERATAAFAPGDIVFAGRADPRQ